jgi:hypothetical protein
MFVDRVTSAGFSAAAVFAVAAAGRFAGYNENRKSLRNGPMAEWALEEERQAFVGAIVAIQRVHALQAAPEGSAIVVDVAPMGTGGP